MSTILKALKQAEKGRGDKGDEGRPSFNIRKALSSRTAQKKKNIFLNSGRIVMVVVLVIVMAIYLYSLFPVNKIIQLQTSSTDKQPRVSVLPPDNEKNQKQPLSNSATQSYNLAETPVKTPPKPEGNSFDLPITPNKKTLKPEFANNLPVGDTTPNRTKEKIAKPFDTHFSKKTRKRAPLKTADELKNTIDNSPASVVEKPTVAPLETGDLVKDKKKGSAQDTPNRKILPLENDGIKIQAISWAQAPKNRIAVIDNRVLRQGDSVQDYRLIEIEKDSVILQYSGNTYRLGFKYR